MCGAASIGMMRALWIISLCSTTYPGVWTISVPLLYAVGSIIPSTPREMQRSPGSMLA